MIVTESICDSEVVGDIAIKFLFETVTDGVTISVGMNDGDIDMDGNVNDADEGEAGIDTDSLNVRDDDGVEEIVGLGVTMTAAWDIVSTIDIDGDGDIKGLLDSLVVTVAVSPCPPQSLGFSSSSSCA